MSQAYPIVGVEDGVGIQPRLELNVLLARPIQFSLFIRAMKKIEDMNSTDKSSPNYMNKPNSWWQMGSIHGLPYSPWSGDPNAPPEPNPDSDWKGYCYHSSALFPPWHRVLVMLIEQSMVNEAISIATELEKTNPAAKKEQWLQAAKTLRFPFWDWTKRETAQIGIPQVCQSTTIGIAVPGGTFEQVDNPLNHYKFAGKPGAAKDLEYMGDWQRTYRWVNQNVNPTEELYDQALKAFVEGGTLPLGGQEYTLQPVNWLREKVASLFTFDLTLDDPSYGPNMWGYFSNTGSTNVYAPMPVMPSSIEEPHNKVHLDTGGNGSMSANEYAEFDPIFFLHHCNIDRLYAFWEYVYPNYWIQNGWKNKAGEIVPFITDEGTYYQKPGAVVDHATVLEPFPNANLTYWTSDDARSLLRTNGLQKYYTYPAITDPRTGVQVKVDVPYDVTDLSLREQYQQTLENEWSADLTTIVQTHKHVSRAQRGQLSQHVNLLLKEEAELSHLRHFIVVGHLPEFAFSGSHLLELYIIPKNPQQQKIVVNSISVLARGNPEDCAACKDRRAAGNQIRGYMHLDPHIILFLLGQLDPSQLPMITTLDHVAALIQGSLGMRIVKPDGTPLAAADVDPRVGTDNSPLDPAKAPNLALHSHFVSFNPSNARVPKRQHSHVSHGEIGNRSGWRAL